MPPIPQRSLDGAYTERRAKFSNVLLRKPADLLHGGPAHGLKSRKLSLHQRKAIFKVLVSGKNDPQQILDKWNHIFGAFMPADLCLTQGLIIEVLVFAILASSEIYLPT